MSDWLRNEIVEGLQALLALRLDGSPAADMVVLTANIWEQAFERKLGKSAIEHIEAPRIREAFAANFHKLRKWPAPVEILDDLPPRPKPQALPEPDVTPEQHRENVMRVKGMVNELLQSWQKGEK